MSSHMELNRVIKKILVCDDILDNAALIQMLLKGEGYVIDVVHSGVAAISQVHNNSYDLLILNIRLPDMTGYDTVRYIQENFQKNISIIFVSGGYAEVFQNQGVVKLLTKLFDNDKFVEQVKLVLA